MFHFAVKRKWIDSNPAYGFEIADAGGTEKSRERWLNREELVTLAEAMRHTENFGRLNELSVWLLLALCVRKMQIVDGVLADHPAGIAVARKQPVGVAG